ncbi:MAG TPA: formimidoylglutamate deiminase [Pyrinomonadaceae bacterium]|nr:formimidoylglutamate deiminase [Pyrinomonadaceae bacterium]
MSETDTLIAWVPDLLYAGGAFRRDRALVCDTAGKVLRVALAHELTGEKRMRLANRAILPGMINSHSHAFQRVLRGRTEQRSFSGGLRPAGSGSSPTLNNQVTQDSFWTWRELMYSAATRLSPEDIYDASRMAFMEMALSGITSVGEFHYLHHSPAGTPYDDPNLLARQVIRAANEVGLRIALLRVAYARSGFKTEPNPQQIRFIESDPDRYVRNLENLIGDLDQASAASPTPATAWAGVAPHSVRAVPLDYLRHVIGFASERNLNVHMHVAEQPAEISACIEEYGRSPVALLDTEGLLSRGFTAVHAIHVTPKAIASFAKTAAMVCACPTTERNLGDGVVPADEYLKHGVQICLGTDSHTQIDLFEDARELEYHLRLQKLERAVLSGAAADLFDMATVWGARSIGAPSGSLDVGQAADFFTIDLNDPSIAGASDNDLLSGIVFSASRAAIREVVVGGKPIVSEGQHLTQEEIVERFNELQKRLWS